MPLHYKRGYFPHETEATCGCDAASNVVNPVACLADSKHTPFELWSFTNMLLRDKWQIPFFITSIVALSTVTWMSPKTIGLWAIILLILFWKLHHKPAKEQKKASLLLVNTRLLPLISRSKGLQKKSAFNVRKAKGIFLLLFTTAAAYRLLGSFYIYILLQTAHESYCAKGKPTSCFCEAFLNG